MKYLFALCLVIVTGCATTERNYDSLYDVPVMSCPSSHILVCEGRNPATMECQCVSRSFERQILQALEY
tara:strand:+ start:1082 stop:1288 length:207 start_codon:yes stop_codon:yes gene_type:complete